MSKNLVCVFLSTIILVGCADHQVYLNTVNKLSIEAVKRYGKDHQYKTHLAVGDEKIWLGMSCKDYHSNKVNYNKNNTFIMLYDEPIAQVREDALKSCEKQVASRKCLMVIEMGACVLDGNDVVNFSNKEQNPTSEMDNAKRKCEELGFSPKTEAFGNCVLKLR
jgi:hypothetical protein